jgi:hypothetical protein
MVVNHAQVSLFSFENKQGQGTIEYLVILAIIVVISLVVVGLVTGMFGAPSTQISTTTDKVGSLTSGGITVVESVSDFSGDSVVRLENVSGENLILNKVSVGERELTFDEQLVRGDIKNFSLSDLGLSCPCIEGQSFVSCSFTFYLTSSTGLQKKQVVTTKVDCLPEALEEPINTIISLDTNAPAIALLSPADNNESIVSNTIFAYNVTDDRNIISCSLLIDGVVDQTDFVAPFNSFTRSFSEEIDYNWNISCTDLRNNTIATQRKITYNNPSTIRTCLELQNVKNDLSGSYALMNDINCDVSPYNSGLGFEPIGNSSTKFVGTFDGNSKSISGLYINRPDSNYVGLFGYISGATIEDVGLIDVDLNGLSYVGSLVGLSDSSSLISNSYSTGVVIGNNYYIGGLVGSLSSGEINNSYSTVSINLPSRLTKYGVYVGGLVGDQSSGNILSSYSSGSLSGFFYVGGLVGRQVDGDINSSYFSGSLVGEDYVGGLVGTQQSLGLVSDCYSTGIIQSTNLAGGFVGTQAGFITSSYSLGNVTGGTTVGGFAGSMSATGLIVKSFSDGNVSGNSAAIGSYYSGGFVGYLVSGDVNDSYSIGSVTRRGGTGTNFGGFVGKNYRGKIFNSYSLGGIHYTGTSDPTSKGFAGAVDTGTGYQMSGNYWDFNTSLQLTTSGIATGKTTTQMKTVSTYSGWSSSIWDLVEGQYPILSWQ